MPRPAITSEKKAKKRSEIREALVRLIRRQEIAPGDTRGYQSITIRDVIEEADISIGTFYKYFKNRAELGQSLWAEPVAMLKLDMQADYDLAKTPVDKIRALLRGYAQFSINQRRVFRAAFLYVRPDEDEKPEMRELDDEMFYRNLRSAFQEGQDLKVFRSFDTHEMAKIFWAALHGSLALPENLDRFDFNSPQTLSTTMIESLLDLIAVN